MTDLLWALRGGLFGAIVYLSVGCLATYLQQRKKGRRP